MQQITNLTCLFKWLVEQRLGGLTERQNLLSATKEIGKSHDRQRPEGVHHIEEGL